MSETSIENSSRSLQWTPGLVSITFRQLAPERIVELVKQAGLSAIEWGGDVHAPHGEFEQAERVRRRTREAGLDVAAYGSYYRAGGSSDEGLTFETVLETARRLEAPTIRVWAGKGGSAEMSESQRRRVIDDLKRCCDLAGKHGVSVSLEYHGNTLTDTREAALETIRAIDHPNLRTYWQPRTSEASTVENAEELDAVLPWLSHLHVFHWHVKPGEGIDRRPLAEGRQAWKTYLSRLEALEGPRALLLEFVRGDDPEQFLDDAASLRRWIGLDDHT